ncbi:hypothetical protein [Streptomyces roseoverticillatus]|uniref:Uncharacterized protein n=1 Tax=Streptomyces roseoverticillatus TaxID=66429 RepID=A0ABV3IMX0_9ACTN
MLIVALDPAAYEKVRAVTVPLLPRGLPDYPPSAVLPWWVRRTGYETVAIRGAIWFDADWTPHFARFGSREPRFNAFSPVESSLAYGLRPVFGRFPGNSPALLRGYLPRRQLHKGTWLILLILLGYAGLVTAFALW